MKEYITIHQVGPLHDLTIEVKPMTVVIGPSSSGKSILMKVLALFRYLFKMANVRSYLHNASISRSPFRLRFDQLTKANGLHTLFSPESQVVYAVVTNDGTRYEIKYQNKKLATLPAIANAHLSFWKESYISESRNMIPNWLAHPAANRNASMGFYFNETLHDFDRSSDRGVHVALPHVGMTYDVHIAGGIKRYTVTPTDGRHATITLDQASSGVQTSAAIPIILNYFAHDFSFTDAFRESVLSYLFEGGRLRDYKPTIEFTALSKALHVHIEEPELSLDPMSQCRLVECVVDLMHQASNNERRLHVMMATHSPYVLTMLNCLIHAAQAGAKHPDQAAAIIPQQYWMDHTQVAAYKLTDGHIEDLVDDEIHFIKAEEIDHVSTHVYDLEDQLSALDD